MRQVTHGPKTYNNMWMTVYGQDYLVFTMKTCSTAFISLSQLSGVTSIKAYEVKVGVSRGHLFHSIKVGDSRGHLLTAIKVGDSRCNLLTAIKVGVRRCHLFHSIKVGVSRGHLLTAIKVGDS